MVTPLGVNLICSKIFIDSLISSSINCISLSSDSQRDEFNLFVILNLGRIFEKFILSMDESIFTETVAALPIWPRVNDVTLLYLILQPTGMVIFP